MIEEKKINELTDFINESADEELINN